MLPNIRKFATQLKQGLINKGIDPKTANEIAADIHRRFDKKSIEDLGKLVDALKDTIQFYKACEYAKQLAGEKSFDYNRGMMELMGELFPAVEIPLSERTMELSASLNIQVEKHPNFKVEYVQNGTDVTKILLTPNALIRWARQLFVKNEDFDTPLDLPTNLEFAIHYIEHYCGAWSRKY